MEEVNPYYERDGITILHGDCRELLPALKGDLIVTDPPYGETSLDWDTAIDGWWHSTGVSQLWCFGSMRFWLTFGPRLISDGWKLGQDIVWEKHNGSSFHADRFRRVHEHALHFYRGAWESLHREVQTTPDATARAVRRKKRPAHTGHIEASSYLSVDGGPRMMRSVLAVRSCHGQAVHPTQKPTGIVEPLIRFSCPGDGLVIDPFMGSGTTLVAARDLGRKAIGVEVEERYCEIAANRLAQGVLPYTPTSSCPSSAP